ncbi:MAG: hypothetical protein FJX52_09935 [Alphaproteobacteria bacterium]|nr:hypothetical protein [Alphaproteobacteria bacterium]
MNLGGDIRAGLGIARLQKDPRGEVGGDSLTMRDNASLSGARDTAGNRGGFGARQTIAFVPRLIDLRGEPGLAATVAAIEDAVERLARLLGLTDVFSCDFRVAAAERPIFLEFEVCPAVTIYDFQDYLAKTHGVRLGPALARSLKLAHGRNGGMNEA